MAEIQIEDLITPQLLKDTLLAGIDLTLDNGDPFPDDLFEEAIRGAISTVEDALQISISKRVILGERHDLSNDQRNAWYGQQLDHRPLQSIQSLQISYGNYSPVDIPDAWLNITSPRFGSVSLIPTAESIGTFRFNNVLPLLIDPISNYGQYNRVPAYFNYKYTAGFQVHRQTIAIQQNQFVGADIPLEITNPGDDKISFRFKVLDDGNGNVAGATLPRITLNSNDGVNYSIKTDTVGVQGRILVEVTYYTIPDSMIKCILYIAAALPLDTAGDLIVGAGIANFNLEVDGLQQRIDTTSSATNSGYGARILSYKRQMEATMKRLKSLYKQPKIAAGF